MVGIQSGPYIDFFGEPGFIGGLLLNFDQRLSAFICG